MLSAEIRNYLKDNGIKQAFLSDKTGLSKDIVSGICTGTRSISCIEYFKICQALNVSVNYFYEKWCERQADTVEGEK